MLNGSDGPLMPAYDTQTVGNSLAWGVVDDAPNSFVWEIGHRSIYGSSPGAVCNPGQIGWDSYTPRPGPSLLPYELVR